MQVVAAFPDGRIEPVVWVHEYSDSQRHPFLLRVPLILPVGTTIRGVPSDAKLVLIPAKRASK